MSDIRTIIFDLDGTLVDTSRDITSAVNFARRKFGLADLTVHEVVRCVGLGVTSLVEQAVVADSDLDGDEVRNIIIDYYTNHLMDETVTYPGILALLEELDGDYNLAVATNKPVGLSVRMVRGLGMEKIFKAVVGPETVGRGKPDPMMLSHIANQFGSKPREVLMIGDSMVDIEASRSFGCRVCAVTWGYNTYEILHASKPDILIHEPLDLLSYL